MGSLVVSCGLCPGEFPRVDEGVELIMEQERNTMRGGRPLPPVLAGAATVDRFVGHMMARLDSEYQTLCVTARLRGEG